MIFMWVTFLTTITIVTTLFFRKRFTYWAKQKVPCLKPSIPFGSFSNPFTMKNHIHIAIKELYDYHKSKGHKYAGIYMMTNPMLLVVDPQVLKNMFVRDFNHFTDRGFYSNEKHDPTSVNLFSLNGSEWRALRGRIATAFTPSKVKTMFPTILECVRKMMDYLQENIECGGDFDVRMLLQSLSAEVIASCAFGFEPNTFKNPHSDFVRMCDKIFETSLLRRMSTFFADSLPSLARKLGIRMYEKHVADYFRGIVGNMIHHRDSNNLKRDDFIQTLLEMRAEKSGEEGLTFEQICAQSFLFFGAGFDTTWVLMTYVLFELALRQDIQERLRNEVVKVLKQHEGQPTYEAVNEMKYLGQVVDETLRKYPPAGALTRKCVSDYKIPGSDVVIKRGTKLIFSIYGLHHDPDYFPEPGKFDPDRFSDENKKSLRGYTYLPFGEGPRICIDVAMKNVHLCNVSLNVVSFVSELSDLIFMDENEKCKNSRKHRTKNIF